VKAGMQATAERAAAEHASEEKAPDTRSSEDVGKS
jgi:hypothetical protein